MLTKTTKINDAKALIRTWGEWENQDSSASLLCYVYKWKEGAPEFLKEHSCKIGNAGRSKEDYQNRIVGTSAKEEWKPFYATCYVKYGYGMYFERLFDVIYDAAKGALEEMAIEIANRDHIAITLAYLNQGEEER